MPCVTAPIVRCGTVKWFNARDGYGFIAREDEPDLFVHHSSIEMNGFRYLRPGQAVEYVLGEGRGGRPEATAVRFIGDDPEPNASDAGSTHVAEETVQVG